MHVLSAFMIVSTVAGMRCQRYQIKPKGYSTAWLRYRLFGEMENVTDRYMTQFEKVHNVFNKV